MADEDLEELNLYLAECREHLSTIEPDLLSMEESGAQIDEVLVNRVFRAAHSIKGGAGFFALHRIQELAHKAENILDMIRSREIVPDPEVINILLLAFDQLRVMINNPQESNQMDITEPVAALTRLASACLPASQKQGLTDQVELVPPSGGSLIRVAEFDLARAEQRDEYVYLVELDLIHDVQRRGKTPWEVFKDYIAAGTILECALNFAAVGTLDDEASNRIPLEILFSTIIDPSFIDMLFDGLPKEQIRLIRSPKNPQPLLRKMDAEKSDAETRGRGDTEKESRQSGNSLIRQSVDSLIRDPDYQITNQRIDESPSPPVSASPRPRVPASHDEGSDSTVEETLRVNVSLLEKLMNLAGELVLSRNQMLEAIRSGSRHDMFTSGQRVSLVTSELQEAIMLTRMQPIGNIFNKFPRVVRDLARSLKKEVQLELIGKDVELDKTIIEGLNDPLTHMVRNALDHGIEPREARLAQGKSPVGKLILKAYHSAGQVIMEVSDDGQGIDPQKVAASAVRRGQITLEQSRQMSEKEKRALIFLPGLSTAEEVSDVSGRGVGMDVVKTNLDRLGGKIEIDSEPGRGTTFRISLPLTLAIIPSLLVTIGEECFAIPQMNISELVHIPADQVSQRFRAVGDAEVFSLRGKLIPVLRLASLLDMENQSQDAGGSEISAAGIEMVVISTGALEYGLIVERLHDTVEIVVRPLGRHLKKCGEYGGATILGDGRLALILDVSGLAARANLVLAAGGAQGLEGQEGQDALEKEGSLQPLLLFWNAPGEQCAIPLEIVTRVERIEPGQVETLGGKRTMQYRGVSLPLVSLRDAAQVAEVDPAAGLVVIVFHIGGHEFGLLGSLPVDAVEIAVSIDQTTLRQPGIAGSAIIRGQTTLMVDVEELIAGGRHGDGETRRRGDEETEFLSPRHRVSVSPRLPVSASPRLPASTILLAEDSDFFRHKVIAYLEGDGYTVLAAQDGEEAWETLLRSDGQVRLVVTDIEMPRLNGLDLTRRIRASAKYAALPVVALTSLASQEEVETGRAAGVDAYEIKLDKENLLESIRRILSGF